MLFHFLVILLNFVLTFAFHPAVLLMKIFTAHVVFVLKCRFHLASILLFNRKLPNGNGAAVPLLHTAATPNQDDRKIIIIMKRHNLKVIPEYRSIKNDQFKVFRECQKNWF